MSLHLHFYQHRIGDAFLHHFAMHEFLMEVQLIPEILNPQRVLFNELNSYFFKENLDSIWKKHIERGIHLREDNKTLAFDLDSLPLKFFPKGYYNSKDIEFSISGGGIADYNGHFLNESYYLFYKTVHPFSQWHKSLFIVNGIEYNSTEQFMMHQKAILFNDREIADKILKSFSPKEQKSLGRQVKNFDADMWNKRALETVYKGNYAKFTQNEELLKLLFSTTGKTIVEASPTDKIWGIGLEEEDERISNRLFWEGTNWLGVILTELREKLRGNTIHFGYFTIEQLKAIPSN